MYFQASGYVAFILTAIIYACIASTNLVPCPATVAENEVFIMRTYPPMGIFTQISTPEHFSLLKYEGNIIYKTYTYKASSEVGFYKYNKNILFGPWDFKVSVVSSKEAKAGVVVPADQYYDRNPLLGVGMQSMLAPIGAGYIYANEVSGEDVWQIQKSGLLSLVSAVVYSLANTSGIKPAENIGLYFGLGTILYTGWDVNRIIQSKNERAIELNRNRPTNAESSRATDRRSTMK